MKSKFPVILLTLMTLVSLLVMPASAAPAGHWVTDFSLYNLSDAPASIVITRFATYTSGAPADTGSLVKSDTIAANGSFYYNPASDTSFPANFGGSIVVSSSAPLAAAVTVANNLTGTAYASDAYVGVTTPATKQFLPIVMGKLGGAGWNTRISVQNAGSSDANFTVTYLGAGAPAVDTIAGLPASRTYQIDQGADPDMNNFNGSAIVESTNGQPLAVVVEEYRNIGGLLVMYNAIPSTDASKTVYMPGYIYQGVWNTDFTIVNTEAVNTNITVNFVGGKSITGPLASGQSIYINNALPNTDWSGSVPADGYYGAATITSSASKVVVAYNIANTHGGRGNLGVGYVGFPDTAAATSVIVPLIENWYSTGWGTTFSVQSVDGTPAKLSMTYSGNLAPKCNPCTYDMVTGESAHTFNQGDSTHVPTGFLGGVTITSDKSIVVIADQNSWNGSSGYSQGDAAAGDEATRRATRPEKTDGSARSSWGLELRKR